MQSREETEAEYLAMLEEVRLTCNRIAAHCLAGRTEAAGKLSLSLSTLATQRKCQREMGNEQANPDRFDLGALSQLPAGGRDELARFDLPDDNDD
jgi:hypothetical protein